ncbi:MAG: membrane protein insertion efficiency factor YidD, partial [Victivallaceae bacterium]|nr:membrane protein insertion efficiency factor YidD [Victivallaceae bacterium]
GSGTVKAVFNCLNPKHALIAAVRLYRICISPWFPPCCRFEPTCSSYAQEALAEHGLLKGLYLSFLRIMRCHPFCRGGYDPVPPKKVSGVSKLSKIRG